MTWSKYVPPESLAEYERLVRQEELLDRDSHPREWAILAEIARDLPVSLPPGPVEIVRGYRGWQFARGRGLR
jgi:hypothetical protein